MRAAYKDVVKIVKGFYRGQSGIVLDVRREPRFFRKDLIYFQVQITEKNNIGTTFIAWVHEDNVEVLL